MHILEGAKKFWEDKDLAQGVHNSMMKDVDNFERGLRMVMGETLTRKKVLDLGCGGGRIFLSYMPWSYVGVDQSKNMIEIAEKECLAAASKTTEEIELHHCDIMEFQSDEHFDVVLLLNVLQHIADPQEMIEHMLSFSADVYAMEFFACFGESHKFHNNSTGRAAISRPESFIQDIEQAMLAKGLQEVRFYQGDWTLGSSVTEVFIAGHRQGAKE